MAHLIAHSLATAMLKLRSLIAPRDDDRASHFPRIEHTPTPWSLYFH